MEEVKRAASGFVIDALCGEETFWSGFGTNRTTDAEAWAGEVTEMVVNAQRASFARTVAAIDRITKSTDASYASKSPLCNISRPH